MSATMTVRGSIKGSRKEVVDALRDHDALCAESFDEAKSGGSFFVTFTIETSQLYTWYGEGGSRAPYNPGTLLFWSELVKAAA